MRRLLLGVLAVALLLPSAAQANTWGSAANGSAAKYVANAERFWEARGGYVDCPMGVEVTWWNWGLGEAGGSNGNNGLGGCHLWLNPDSWPTIAPSGRCHVLLHEWGHLVGLSHESDPNHVMHSPIVRIHPSCRRFDR